MSKPNRTNPSAAPAASPASKESTSMTNPADNKMPTDAEKDTGPIESEGKISSKQADEAKAEEGSADNNAEQKQGSSSSGTIAASAAAPIGQAATQDEVVKAESNAEPVDTRLIKHSAETQALFDRVYATGDSTAIAILQSLEAYMDVMAPGNPIDYEDGSREQGKLYRALQSMINDLTGDTFQLTYATVLKLFADHSQETQVFSGRYVFRFASASKLRAEDLEASQRLLNLLTITGPSKGRKESLKQVDLNKTLLFGITEEGKSRVLSFYAL